jgi:hypothetical protein
MPEPRLIVFLVLMAGVAATIPFVARRARRTATDRVRRARESLALRGHAVEECTNQNGRRFVRVWGALEHPVALELRIFRRALYAKAFLGRDSRSGMVERPEFTRAFRVATNDPNRVRSILGPEVQDRLLALPKLDLRVGSLHSLLTPEYWADEDLAAQRKIRGLWMVRIPGRLSKKTAVAEMLEAGELVSRAVTKHCMPPQTADRSDFETTSREGQWV